MSVCVTRAEPESPGQIATTGGHVFRLVDGLIEEAWGFVDDQEGRDRLLSA